MGNFKKKTLNVEELLRKTADYREFMGENQETELSEEELDFVAAARAVPDYQDFLRQLERQTKEEA